MLSNIENRVRFDVFISYSSANNDAAHKLLDALKATGIKCFFAPNDINRFVYDDAEDQFVSPLKNALIRSCQCVALLSKAYLASAWCELELIGAFNLSKPKGRRTLHLYQLEEVKDQVIGQLHGYIRDGTFDDVVRAVVKAKNASDLKVGTNLGNNPRQPFVDLPLRKYYEPPGAAPRAPWGFDSRSPRATPGAPSYSSYQDLVREYMVQINRLGGPPSPFEENRELELKLVIPNLPDKYAFINKRAREDANRLLREGVSPTPWRPSFRDIWADASEARDQQGDTADVQNRFGLVKFWEGNWQQALNCFQKAVQMRNPPDDADVAYLAATYYQMKDYQKAADLLAPLSGKKHFLVAKVLVMILARLGRVEEAARQRDIVMGIAPDFNLLQERVDTWFLKNKDLEHWIEGLNLAGFR